MPSHPRASANAPPPPPTPSSSRSPQPSVYSNAPSTLSSPEPPPKSFNRLRETLRTATRSRKMSVTTAPEDVPSLPVTNIKGKGRVSLDEPPKEKERQGMLRRLESRVTFRRSNREALAENVHPPPPPTLTAAERPELPEHSPSGHSVLQHKTRKPSISREARGADRAPGSIFISPSMREGSVSSPALHLSSQAIPSSKSRPSIQASSSPQTDGLAPPRERARRVSLQPVQQTLQRQTSSPTRYSQDRPPPPSSSPRTPSREPLSRHRSTRSTPIHIPTLAAASTASFQYTPPDTRNRDRDLPSPPTTPTPTSGSRGQLGVRPSGSPGLNSRGGNPIVQRSPSRTRVITTPAQRGLASTSVTHLPIPPSSSPPPRRTSFDLSRKPLIETPPRRSSISPGRDETTPSPSRRSISPTQKAYAGNRHYSMSSASLASPPEHREMLRTAITMLCREVGKPPLSKTEAAMKDWEEVELRMRRLVRLERVWANVAGSPPTNGPPGPSSSIVGVGGEERERRLFCEALKDGFVLCQLINRLRSSSIVRPDPREDGVVRLTNITKFLAACSSYGLLEEDLFLRDDFMEATSESLARVARTIIALVRYTPSADPSRILSGNSRKTPHPIQIPYTSHSRGAASTPNLHRQGSVSPQPTSPTRKRWSPPSDLPTVRQGSSHEGSSSVCGRKDDDDETAEEAEVEPRNVRQPPPRSPLRPAPAINNSAGGGLFTWAKKAASPRRSSVADSTRASVGDISISDSVVPVPNVRQSVISTAMTDTTATTNMSSLFDGGRTRVVSNNHNKFGTIRTVTTDVTSESPSFTRAEGSAVADDLSRKRNAELPLKVPRERRAVDTPSPVDLTRVAEETDESASNKSRPREHVGGRRSLDQPAQNAERSNAVYIGKGKWPDDFLDVFQSKPPRPNAIRSSTDVTEAPLPNSSLSNSTSPPRKVAIVDSSPSSDNPDVPRPFPRRPSHRSRQSVDAPVLMPKQSLGMRDASPDGLLPLSSRVVPRRASSKSGLGQRNGVYLPRGSAEDPRNSENERGDSPVPFPRTASAEHGPSSPPRSSGGENGWVDRPHPPRGRFQSEVDGSSTRRARPSSYDDAASKVPRSRIESMKNLGVTSNASASDLLSRDSADGSAVRKTLIVREDGKPPTHFQLGNCIGRGQFGSVYRALNLNTGQMVAVKRIRLEGLKEDEVTTLMREVDLVKSLSHPSIVKYEGMARDQDTLSIVLEYAENGSLGQTLKAFGKLNERLVASYVVKILEGLHYLHRCDVVHCDLKAANILTTKNGNVKLSDFGVSLNLRAMEREIKDVTGTPNWMAPEVIELKGASTKSDIWSLGCTVIELLTGRPPYADIANSMSVMFRIVEDDQPPLPEGCSQLLQNFLSQCFHKDPVKRPSAEMLCEHPWLKKNWGIHKELRPQDSIPFLRRVSVDLQKSEVARYLSQIELPEQLQNDGLLSPEDNSQQRPIRRMSTSSLRPTSDSDISPREHAFVKTTFSKPMICRVCLLNVKKSAVLCAECSLIAHSKCAPNSPPTCDLRAQLLLYAQYAAKDNPSSAYSNPLDILNDARRAGPVSDVAYVSRTPRTSVDGPPLAATPEPISQSPTAFKFMSAFKRSRTSLTPEPPNPSSPSPTPPLISKPEKLVRKTSLAVPSRSKNLSHERPRSIASSGNASSTRSAATAAESLSSRQEATRRSQRSGEMDNGANHPDSVLSAEELRQSQLSPMSDASHRIPETRESKMNGIPGGFKTDHRAERKQEGKCTIQ